MLLTEDVVFVLGRLNDAGFSAFLVGGAVRDMLLNQQPHDFDVTTSATPEQLTAVFKDEPTAGTVNRFGTLSVRGIEVTTMRKDHAYGDHRRPDSVTFTTDLNVDLARRDFTINAIAVDAHEVVHDPFFGLNDLRNGRLRTVGPAKERFNEDALRILRAVRLSAKLDFTPDKATNQAMADMAMDVRFVSPERIGVELEKMLMLPKRQRDRAIFMMGRSAILTTVLPGAVLPTAMLMTKLNSSRSVLAALLRFEGRASAVKTVNSLALGGKLAGEVGHLVECRSIPVRADDPVMVRRFIAEVGRDFIDEAMTLNNEDEAAREAVAAQLDKPLTLSELALNGSEVSAIIGAGPRVGLALRHLLDLVVSDPSLNHKEQLLDLLRAHRGINF